MHATAPDFINSELNPCMGSDPVSLVVAQTPHAPCSKHALGTDPTLPTAPRALDTVNEPDG